MTTRLQLLNDALVLNGSEPLASETAPGAETYVAVFDRVSELILTCHPWSFNHFTRELNRRTAPPGIHWAYAYELPAEMLGSPRAYFNQSVSRIPFTDLELFGEREVRSNAERLWCFFPKRVPPSSWPGYVREVIVLLTRSELALAVREDRVLRDVLRANAIGSGMIEMQGGILGQARGINDMSRPSQGLADHGNPLIDVRSSSGVW